MSRVTCRMSGVTCHMPRVTCHVSHYIYKKENLDKVVKLIVGGSVINGPTPSSFYIGPSLRERQESECLPCAGFTLLKVILLPSSLTGRLLGMI